MKKNICKPLYAPFVFVEDEDGGYYECEATLPSASFPLKNQPYEPRNEDFSSFDLFDGEEFANLVA
ncbi:MAG: hypothetical protein LBB67_07855 [Oscillospiraceae bacterium]|jgi:hypothetical protein|nr:hypothetical protein [Oscillospiraceae bacterium]